MPETMERKMINCEIVSKERVVQGSYIIQEGATQLVSAIWISNLKKETLVEIGQVVASNGRIFKPAGMRGVVFRIHEPFTSGFSNDVIEVRWADGTCNSMKYKDLILLPLTDQKICD